MENPIAQMNIAGDRLLDFIRLERVPNEPSIATEVLNLAKDLMDVALDYFSQGRYELHSVHVKDASGRTFYPDLAIHLLTDPSIKHLVTCKFCNLSFLTKEVLNAHVISNHKEVHLLLQSSLSVARQSKSNNAKRICSNNKTVGKKRQCDYRDEGEESLDHNMVDSTSINTKPMATHIVNEQKQSTSEAFIPVTCKFCDLSFMNIEILNKHVDSNHKQEIHQHLQNSLYGTQANQAKRKTGEFLNSGNKTLKVQVVYETQEGEEFLHHKTAESTPVNTEPIYVPQPCTSVVPQDSIAINIAPQKIESKDPAQLSSLNECPICSNTFTTYEESTQHLSIAHRISIDDVHDGFWKCNICNILLKGKGDYAYHIHNIHGVEMGNMNPWYCTYCRVLFNEKYAFARHILGHVVQQTAFPTNTSETQNVWVCPQCDDRQITAEDILAHINDFHIERKITMKDLRYCPSCGKKEHGSTIDQHLSFVCDDCGEKFCRNSDLAMHAVKVHNFDASTIESSDLACQHCGKVLSTAHNLKRHIFTSHDKGTFLCPICKANPGSRRYLINHIVNIHHKDERSAKQLIHDYPSS